MIGINVNTRVEFSDYEFVTKPTKLAWNKDISFRYENILQTQEFTERFSDFLHQDFSGDQIGIDHATDLLSGLLIEGAIRSSPAIQYNRKAKQNCMSSSKKLKKKQRSHPKWHDKSCADAHRDVVLTSKLLKGDPKNS